MATPTTLAERWRAAREYARIEGKNEFDRRLGKAKPGSGGGSGFTSKVEGGITRNPDLETVALAAHVAGVRAAWFAFGDGSMTGGQEVERLAEMPAVTFISRLAKLPKLSSTVDGAPEKEWKLWHLAGVLADYGNAPNLVDSDGNPVSGRGTWAEMLDEKAGLTPPGKATGGIARARAAHRKEHPRKAPP